MSKEEVKERIPYGGGGKGARSACGRGSCSIGTCLEGERIHTISIPFNVAFLLMALIKAFGVALALR